MPLVQYDIQQLFSIIWNYRALPFPGVFIGELNKVNSHIDYSEAYIPQRKEMSDIGGSYYGKNLLGLEVFMPITLTYKDPQNKDTNKASKIAYQLENTVISVNLRKTIVETSLVNRQGTVKEIISIDAWEIDVRGVIVNDANDYPDSEVQKLRNLVMVNTSLEIENVLTAILLSGDEKVIIKDFNLPDMKGIQNAQAFEMKLSSDTDFELILDKK